MRQKYTIVYSRVKPRGIKPHGIRPNKNIQSEKWKTIVPILVSITAIFISVLAAVPGFFQIPKKSQIIVSQYFSNNKEEIDKFYRPLFDDAIINSLIKSEFNTIEKASLVITLSNKGSKKAENVELQIYLPSYIADYPEDLGESYHIYSTVNNYNAHIINKHLYIKFDHIQINQNVLFVILFENRIDAYDIHYNAPYYLPFLTCYSADYEWKWVKLNNSNQYFPNIQKTMLNYINHTDENLRETCVSVCTYERNEYVLNHIKNLFLGREYLPYYRDIYNIFSNVGGEREIKFMTQRSMRGISWLEYYILLESIVKISKNNHFDTKTYNEIQNFYISMNNNEDIPIFSYINFGIKLLATINENNISFAKIILQTTFDYLYKERYRMVFEATIFPYTKSIYELLGDSLRGRNDLYDNNEIKRLLLNFCLKMRNIKYGYNNIIQLECSLIDIDIIRADLFDIISNSQDDIFVFYSIAESFINYYKMNDIEMIKQFVNIKHQNMDDEGIEKWEFYTNDLPLDYLSRFGYEYMAYDWVNIDIALSMEKRREIIDVIRIIGFNEKNKQ